MKKIKDFVGIVVRGFCVGASMLVPGVSGGSMAMILGIYDRLIHAISTFFSNIKRNIFFLLLFCAGAGVGVLLCARPLEALLEMYPGPVRFFFLGAVAGGIPMIIKKAQVKTFSFKYVVYVGLGGLAVWLISLVPKDLLSGDVRGIAWVLLFLVCGLFLSVALVLPGISFTHMLLSVGIYDKVLAAINARDIVYLLPLGVGTVLGIFLCTKILEKAMKKHPQQTFLIILGFILVSLVEILPAIVLNWTLILSIILAAIGFGVVFFLSRFDT